jgi:phosphoglycolate phosphatase
VGEASRTLGRASRPVDLLIFDLDGTLIDSKLDLAISVNAARGHLGLAPLDLAVIMTYVGYGAPILIQKALAGQTSESQIAQALEFFLDYYGRHALDSTRFYPGVRESLERLHRGAKRLAILSNKPVAISRMIIEGLNAAELFFRVYGGDSFGAKKPDPAGIAQLMRETGVGPDATMMIGDSMVDVQAARNAGVRSCGVRFGFAPDAFDRAPPDLVVGHMEELADWVLSLISSS